MWIAATLIASLAQTGRNAAQMGLTARIGTMGATGVRFVFGLPFALLFLAMAALLGPVPMPDATVFGYAALGAVAQIAAILMGGIAGAFAAEATATGVSNMS